MQLRRLSGGVLVSGEVATPDGDARGGERHDRLHRDVKTFGSSPDHVTEGPRGLRRLLPQQLASAAELWYLQGPSVSTAQPGLLAAAERSTRHQAAAPRPRGAVRRSRLQKRPEIGSVSARAAGPS